MTRFRIPRNWLFLIAALGLVTLCWSYYLMTFGHPYSGITWSYTSGMIINVEAGGPAAELLLAGDRIIRIDGVPVYEARNLPDRGIDDEVIFTVERQGKLFTQAVQLTAPPISELSKRLSIIPVAFTFWLLGIVVLAFGQPDRLINLFFFFCQAVTIMLGLGAISSYAPLWSSWIFGLLLWWIGPITFHTHLALSFWEGTQASRRLILLLYGFALFFSLLDLIRLQAAVVSLLFSFKYIWVGIFIIASAFTLIYTSFWDMSTAHRRRTMIAGVSAVSAFMPFVFWSLIPEAITGQFILPYEITLLALLILPLGYSYAILRYRLLKIEREISQSAAYGLAIFIVSVLYAFVYIYASNALAFPNRTYSIFEILLVVVLALTAQPVHQALYRWFYQVFYGGWLDEREAVRQMIQDLKYVTGDTYSIAQTLCLTLQRTMLLEYVNLLLSDGCLITTTKDQTISSEVLFPHKDQISNLFNNLKEKTGRELGPGEVLKEFLNTTGEENGSLLGPRPHLWLLFGGRSDWEGLLVLGSKRGRGDFGKSDLEILEVVLRQAGAALENQRLLNEVSQRSNQIRELSRKTRWVLEVERKRIARDLHDIVIQTLVGINFQLANARASHNPQAAQEVDDIRGSLRESVVELRNICADLRPPALDALGLVPALEARITEIRSQVPFEINLKTANLGAYEVRDDVALCVYRFVQEALLNIQKHSRASMVMMDLHVDQENRLHLSVKDDGIGFTPPPNLEVLVAEQHYGLIGLQEQVEAVGGRIVIDSEIGKGCVVAAWIPLYQSSPSAQQEIETIKEET